MRKSQTNEVASRFAVEEVVADLPPSFNVAPTQDVAVIVNEGARRLAAMRWGLVPSWATGPAIATRLINARAESLTAKPAFKDAFRRRRCLVVADGFYEWRKLERGKTPLLIRLKTDRPFAFAGLFEVWRPPLGEPLTTCTIITTQPNELVKSIHDRMPVILPKDLENFWLDETVEDHTRLLDLLRPYPTDEMEAYAVSTLVNSVKNDSPACIQPASVSPVGQQGLLF